MIKLNKRWIQLLTFIGAAAHLSFNVIYNPPVHEKVPLPFFKIGHRGTRGLMPENTIPAMKKAIELGVNTLEMDIHITKDGKVMVYHDNSVNPEYTLMPDGTDIPPQERKKYTFYQMDYAYIRSFIIGTKKYAAFPQQEQMASYAPLLSELIDSTENFTKINKLKDVNYLIEIKSDPQTDGFEQPAPTEVVNKLMQVLAPKKLGKRLIIQSFDMRPLKVLHQKYPKVLLGFLTGDHQATIEENLANLGFKPLFYNPYMELVNEELVNKCHEKGMYVAPWTVNEIKDMQRIKALKVDGIITDYPNLFSELKY